MRESASSSEARRLPHWPEKMGIDPNWILFVSTLLGALQWMYFFDSQKEMNALRSQGDEHTKRYFSLRNTEDDLNALQGDVEWGSVPDDIDIIIDDINRYTGTTLGDNLLVIYNSLNSLPEGTDLDTLSTNDQLEFNRANSALQEAQHIVSLQSNAARQDMAPQFQQQLSSAEDKERSTIIMFLSSTILGVIGWGGKINRRWKNRPQSNE